MILIIYGQWHVIKDISSVSGWLDSPTMSPVFPLYLIVSVSVSRDVSQDIMTQAPLTNYWSVPGNQDMISATL